MGRSQALLIGFVTMGVIGGIVTVVLRRPGQEIPPGFRASPEKLPSISPDYYKKRTEGLSRQFKHTDNEATNALCAKALADYYAGKDATSTAQALLIMQRHCPPK